MQRNLIEAGIASDFEILEHDHFEVEEEKFSENVFFPGRVFAQIFQKKLFSSGKQAFGPRKSGTSSKGLFTL